MAFLKAIFEKVEFEKTKIKRQPKKHAKLFSRQRIIGFQILEYNVFAFIFAQQNHKRRIRA